jgi:hypothetical protein
VKRAASLWAGLQSFLATRKWQHAFLLLVVLSFALAGASILVNAHDVNANNHKWCALVGTVNKSAASAKHQPAADSFTADFIAEIRYVLRGEFGCG